MAKFESVDVREASGLSPEFQEELVSRWKASAIPSEVQAAIFGSLSMYSKKGLKVSVSPEGVSSEVFGHTGLCSNCAAETQEFHWYDVGDASISNPICGRCYRLEKSKPFGMYDRVVVYRLELTEELFRAVAVWWSSDISASRASSPKTRNIADLLGDLDTSVHAGDLF